MMYILVVWRTAAPVAALIVALVTVPLVTVALMTAPLVMAPLVMVVAEGPRPAVRADRVRSPTIGRDEASSHPSVSPPGPRVRFAPREGVLRVIGGLAPGRQIPRPNDKSSNRSAPSSESLSVEARDYLSRLAALRPASSDQESGRDASEQVSALMRHELTKLQPIVYLTRHPLSRPSAAGSMIGRSEPLRWGCAVRVVDPAHLERAPRTVFSDPDGSIFDMSLSFDARSVFFSFKKQGEPCWQIYEIGIDGRGLTKISRDPHSCDISPVELPSGELLYVSTRQKAFLLSETGPRSNLHVMQRDGGQVRCVSSNTLSDFSPRLLPDGRVLFTRWEYVDRDVEYRLGLWTQRPDGRQFELFFGNTVRDVGMFWQARPVPGHQDLVVATFAPHNGWPHGAIGLVHNRLSLEGPRDQGYAWLTDESLRVGNPTVHLDGMNYEGLDDGRLLNLALNERALSRKGEPTDLSIAHELEADAAGWFDGTRWAYRDPFPVNDFLFLVAHGGGSRTRRFGLYLVDLCGNQIPIHSESDQGCYSPLILGRSGIPPTPGAMGLPAGSTEGDESWATVLLVDVYRGLTGVARGQAHSLRIMEQVPKTSDGRRRAYDQSPLIGYGTSYVKRCWGQIPLESDGSAHFRVPAMREIYFQVLDAEGRELQRQTSSVQFMPRESRSCIGCHEPRHTAAPSGGVPIAALKPPVVPVPPAWTDDGIVDFAHVVQPVLDRHCGRCHRGAEPAGRFDLSADKTRFFNMAYDNLLGRSRSYRQHSLTSGRMLSQEAAKGRPLVHFFWLRRAPTAVNEPQSSGSYVSRLTEYFRFDHCGRNVSMDDLQRVRAWIDANVPFYGHYSVTRPLSPGGRDLYADARTGDDGSWFAGKFLDTYRRRCASCHGEFPHPNDHDQIWDGRFAWINLTHPEWSSALTAHLGRESGGWALPTNRLDPSPLFQDTSDPDYLTLLNAIREGRQQSLNEPAVTE